jgi:hypothetical protein
LRQRRDSLRPTCAQQNIAEIEHRSLEQRVAAWSRRGAGQRQIATSKRPEKRSGTLTGIRRCWRRTCRGCGAAETRRAPRAQARPAFERNRSVCSAICALTESARRTQSRDAAAGINAKSPRPAAHRIQARRALVIAPPRTGSHHRLAEEGQNATTSTPLLSILPADAELQAQLLVPSRSIGFIAVKQTVALRYQAFPYQRFGIYRGRVIEISKTLINPSDATLPATLQEPAYRVTVALEAQSVNAYHELVSLQAPRR